jgi:hypothetical protein
LDDINAARQRLGLRRQAERDAALGMVNQSNEPGLCSATSRLESPVTTAALQVRRFNPAPLIYRISD